MASAELSSDTLISMKNVGLFYWRRTGYFRQEKFWALRDVSLELREGECLGVIGRNGAGKSTLLSMLANIIRPDRGEMVNRGGRAALLSLQIGFVPYLTGRENACLSGMLMGLTRKQILDRMPEIIAFSELEDFIDQRVSTYSSGMRARLGFSVAFQIDPEILLIDEVLGVGDADFKDKSAAVLHEKIHSRKTVVLVSHNAKTIEELCDRAVWIENGVTQVAGETRMVLEAYRDFCAANKILRVVPLEESNPASRGNVIEIYRIVPQDGPEANLAKQALPIGWRLVQHKDLKRGVIQYRGGQITPLRITTKGEPMMLRLFQSDVGGRLRLEFGGESKEVDLYTDKKGGQFVEVVISFKPPQLKDGGRSEPLAHASSTR